MERPIFHIIQNFSFPAGAAADVNAICAQVKKRQDEIASLTEDFMAVLRAKKVNISVQ